LPSGAPSPEIPFARSYATYLDNLRRALELFEPHGVGVLIEPINRVDIPGYFLDLPLARRVVAIPTCVSCSTSIMSRWKASIPRNYSVKAAPISDMSK
jgi:hypothetical protein